MFIIKVFVWYVAVIFCYARNVFIWKGTRWCGYGSAPSLSKNFSSALLLQNETPNKAVSKSVDQCCRGHDHCAHFIPRWTRKYNLLNWRPYTISSCDCDEKFRKCLDNDTSTDARDIGKIYFEILEVPCFRLKVREVEKCVERTWFMGCKKHAMMAETFAALQLG